MEYQKEPNLRHEKMKQLLFKKTPKPERSMEKKPIERKQPIRKANSYQKIKKINYKTSNENFYDSDTIKTIKSKSNSSQPKDPQ